MATRPFVQSDPRPRAIHAGARMSPKDTSDGSSAAPFLTDPEPLERAPWPVVRLSRSGTVQAANAAGHNLFPLLRTPSAQLADAIAGAADGAVTQVSGVGLDPGSGATPAHGERSFDITVLPEHGRATCLLVGRETTLWRSQWAALRHEASNCKRELSRVRQREQLLQAILRLSRKESGPSAILETAAQGVLPALDAEGASVYRLVEGRFVNVAHAGTSPPPATIERALDGVHEGETLITSEDGGADLMTLATMYDERVNGALVLWHCSGLRGWSEDERLLAGELAAQIAVANAQLGREAELRQLSETDSLTGLLNRRAFLGRLDDHLKHTTSTDALLYIDLDNFKQVNDARGHLAGDDVLQAVGRLLQAHSRDRDVAARLGGDEFALLLIGIHAETAQQRAATLVRTAAEALAGESGDPSLPLGASIGIAMSASETRESPSGLLERADAAMYRAKKTVKGGVALADPPLDAPRPTPTEDE